MTDSIHTTSSDGPSKANHLCVLVHGLWGNSQHLDYIAQALRDKYDEDELVLLSCKKNASFFTYDGIEIGGERVAKEIEETLERLTKDGCKITKFSILGYSLGGLFARYAIGLLDHKGYFDHITPVNFTTFASPHLGARTPLLGYSNHIWNSLGARTLSASGRQLFGIDEFRDTGRSLLSVLADPKSIFIHALSRFSRRSLYTNIINDRTAVYYTTSISTIDPYIDLAQLKLRYVPGYESVILDSDQPYEKIANDKPHTFYQRIKGKSKTYLRRAPIFVALAIMLPLGIVAFAINSTIQTIRSRKRIMLHEKDEEGQGFGLYRIPLLRNFRAGLEDAFESTNAAQAQDYLPIGSEHIAQGLADRTASLQNSSRSTLSLEKEQRAQIAVNASAQQHPEFPTLALTTDQFAMVQALDEVGFRKHPVHIHKTRHSHAAIIFRHPRDSLDEGKVVIKHWLDREFEI